jgi:hypothetical protein
VQQIDVVQKIKEEEQQDQKSEELIQLDQWEHIQILFQQFNRS